MIATFDLFSLDGSLLDDIMNFAFNFIYEMIGLINTSEFELGLDSAKLSGETTASFSRGKTK